jgi:hypothetical protein
MAYNLYVQIGLIKSSNATQIVFSDWVILQYAVLQGSIRESLLLMIHINDIPLRNIL